VSIPVAITTHALTCTLTSSILSMVVPVYNAELAPKNLRGRLVSLNQLAITAGIMVGGAVGCWGRGMCVYLC